MIYESPLPPESEWSKEFCLWRRIGNYFVIFDWVEHKVVHHGNHWEYWVRDLDGKILDTGTGVSEGW